MARLSLLVLVWLLVCSALATPCHAARTALYTGAPITVSLALGQPTALTFPEPLTAVPTGADPTTLSLEVDGPRLFLQPLTEQVEGLLFALGTSGTLYPVRFAVQTPADIAVEIMVPAPPSAPPQAPPDTSPMRALLVALLRGTTLPGATTLPHRQVLLETPAVQVVTTQVQLAGAYLGYTATATNRTGTPLPLLLPEYTAPGLAAIAAVADTIPPHGTTRMILVIHPAVSH